MNITTAKIFKILEIARAHVTSCLLKLNPPPKSKSLGEKKKKGVGKERKEERQGLGLRLRLTFLSLISLD